MHFLRSTVAAFGRKLFAKRHSLQAAMKQRHHVSRAAVIALCGLPVITCACEGPPPLPLPSPQPPAASFETFSVEGTVWNHTASGLRPLPGLEMIVSGVTLASDAEGQFKVDGFPRRTFVTITVLQNPEYLNPCPSASSLSPRSPIPTLRLDVDVVSRTLLLTSNMPSSLPIPWGSVYGVISEVTPSGKVPVQGATVELFFPNPVEAEDYSSVGASAETLTDASGGYAMCSHHEWPGIVRARKNGYRDALATWLNGQLNVELSRN